jgi:hypothetical protein
MMHVSVWRVCLVARGRSVVAPACGAVWVCRSLGESKRCWLAGWLEATDAADASLFALSVE